MSTDERATKAAGKSRLKKLAIWAGVLIAVFLLGYVPPALNANRLRDENAQLQHQLRLAGMRVRLGMTSYEANRNNYTAAAEHSTAFFDGLRAAIPQTTDGALRAKLQAVLARRDEITATLTEANPGVKEKLAQMYAEFPQS
jgi:hypothetical protein